MVKSDTDGACPGPVQQLAGLVEAAPARTDRPMTLIWRPDALIMVLGHVLGQECLIPLIIHSEETLTLKLTHTVVNSRRVHLGSRG